MLFKSIHARLFGALVGAAVLLSACNSSDGGGAATGPTLTGVAATGAPISGATVTATGANGQIATATTSADGSYSISNNLSALTFPIQISVSFPRGGEIVTLRSLAVAAGTGGATRANITPLTDVIAENAQGVAAADLPALVTRINGILAAILTNLGVDPSTNFLSGNFVANPDNPIDRALDLVTVEVDGNTVTVSSNVDPSQPPSTVTITANTSSQDVTPIPAPDEAASASPADIKMLVDALAVELNKRTSATSAGFNSIFHAGYKDDEGFDQAGFANSVVEAAQEGIFFTVRGYKILRCYEDSGSVTDKCLVRVNVTTTTAANEDFGASNSTAVASEFFDYIMERRANVNGLRIAGGFFRPYAARINLFLSNTLAVNSDGSTNANTSISTALSILARQAVPGATATQPEDIANDNLQSISVVKTTTDAMPVSSVVMSVARNTGVQCSGANNRFNVNPVNSANCGNQMTLLDADGLVQDSANGLISAEFTEIGASEAVVLPMLRIGSAGGADLTKFGSIDQTGLANLVTYSQAADPVNVQLTLTKPASAVNVCLSDGGVNEDICVFATRTITIPSNMLRKGSAYFVITRDADNNVYQRTYSLAR